MIHLKKVLIPIDFSASAQNAIQYCLGLMLHHNLLEVTLLHVYQGRDGIAATELQKRLNHLQYQFESAHLICTTLLKEGPFTSTVAACQKECGADLILCGTSGDWSESQVTHTSDLVQSVDCPVLVVPENVNSYKIKNIALTMDQQRIDDATALEVLFDLARANQAKIHLLTINNQGLSLDKLNSRENDEILDYYFQQLDYHHAYPEHIDIEQGILDYVRKHQIDLLAIMPRHHAQKSEPSSGHLTKLLALHSTVPLLTLD